MIIIMQVAQLRSFALHAFRSKALLIKRAISTATSDCKLLLLLLLMVVNN